MNPAHDGTVAPSRTVTVVGSVNRDVVVRVPRLPRPGETLASLETTERVGGKGANQAVAAARLGAPTEWIGAVGEDGVDVLAALTSRGVDTRRARRVADARTGMALVLVDDAGENAIVLDAGANGGLRPADVPDDLDGVVLVQHEVPPDVVEHVVRTAAAAGATTILNPAPYRAIPRETLAAVDVLVVNATELAELAGRPGAAATPTDASAMLAAVDTPGTVIATLGPEGVLIRHDGAAHLLTAPPVTAVDTVGAGDAFCGALAAQLATGRPMLAAATFAVHAASLSVTRHGAQEAMPTAADVEQFQTQGAARATTDTSADRALQTEGLRHG